MIHPIHHSSLSAASPLNLSPHKLPPLSIRHRPNFAALLNRPNCHPLNPSIRPPSIPNRRRPLNPCWRAATATNIVCLLFAITMVKDPPIPFEVGQFVEATFFIKGFKGAWFRCEITKITSKKNRVHHMLRYLDFPSEKEEWTMSYQVPPARFSKKRKKFLVHGKRGIKRKRQLMLRPPYPPVYRKDQLPPASEFSEAIVITEGNWCVGDLVEWQQDDCYWLGKVTHLLGNEEAMVELLPPPLGEGRSYQASFCDLRPSLDWSVEDGWTVPTSKDIGNSHQCARIMYPVTQIVGSQSARQLPAQIEGMIDHQIATRPSSALSFGSHVAIGPPGEKEMQMESPQEMQIESTEKEISALETSIKPLLWDNSNSSKKFRARTEIPLNSTKVDTLDAAMIDLEELANKLRWFKDILKLGMPLSNASQPSWKFLEHRGSSMPK